MRDKTERLFIMIHNKKKRDIRKREKMNKVQDCVLSILLMETGISGEERRREHRRAAPRRLAHES